MPQAAQLQPNDPFIMNLTGNLFALSHKFTLAEQYAREAYQVSEHGLGPDHWLTVMCLQNLVGHLRDQGKNSEAFDLYLLLIANEEAAIFSKTDALSSSILNQMRRGQMDVEFNGLSLYGVVIYPCDVTMSKLWFHRTRRS